MATTPSFPDLRSPQPVAGPLVRDIRIAEWSPLAVVPLRFLRVTQVGDVSNAVLFLWWIGNRGPYEPAADPSVRCTEPNEGPRTCIVPLPLKGPDEWQPLVRSLLTTKECKLTRPTDAFELRVQLFERVPTPRYREYEVCHPMATTFRELLDALSRREFKR